LTLFIANIALVTNAAYTRTRDPSLWSMAFIRKWTGGTFGNSRLCQWRQHQTVLQEEHNRLKSLVVITAGRQHFYSRLADQIVGL